jgi:DNA-binding MarR family transcriptional regulator
VSETRWLDEAEMRAWRALLEVHAHLMARLNEELLAGHGVSLPDYEVLIHLADNEQRRMRMAELADRLLLSPSGVTRRLDGLVRKGLVSRETCSTDRRGSYAVLTPAGLALLQEAAPTHVTGVRRYLIDELSAAELASLAAILERVGEALGPGPECPEAAVAQLRGPDALAEPRSGPVR